MEKEPKFKVWSEEFRRYLFDYEYLIDAYGNPVEVDRRGNINKLKDVTMTTNFNYSDKKHLQWIYDRLKSIYYIDENVDYMLRMQEILDKM